MHACLQVSRFKGLNELLTDILPRHVAEVLLSKKMQERQHSHMWTGLQRLSHTAGSATADTAHTDQVWKPWKEEQRVMTNLRLGGDCLTFQNTHTMSSVLQQQTAFGLNCMTEFSRGVICRFWPPSAALNPSFL